MFIIAVEYLHKAVGNITLDQNFKHWDFEPDFISELLLR